MNTGKISISRFLLFERLNIFSGFINKLFLPFKVNFFRSFEYFLGRSRPSFKNQLSEGGFLVRYNVISRHFCQK